MRTEALKNEPLPLSDAVIGMRYLVTVVSAQGVIRQRMLDMGLVPGARLVVVRFAPLGDPIEIRINRFFMSLRKEEARQVEVLPLGPCPRREQATGTGFMRRFRGNC